MSFMYKSFGKVSDLEDLASVLLNEKKDAIIFLESRRKGPNLQYRVYVNYGKDKSYNIIETQPVSAKEPDKFTQYRQGAWNVANESVKFFQNKGLVSKIVES